MKSNDPDHSNNDLTFEIKANSSSFLNMLYVL